MLMSLLSEATGKSWTLRPNRCYIIGSSSGCDIVIPGPGVSSQHLQLKFNSVSNEWRLEKLSEDAPIIINGVPATEQGITQATRISVGNEVFVATPQIESNVADVSEPSFSRTNQNLREGRTLSYATPMTKHLEDDSISIKLNLRPLTQLTSKVDSLWKVMSITDRLLLGILLVSTLNTLVILSTLPLIMSASSVIARLEGFANRMEPMVNQIERELNQFFP